MTSQYVIVMDVSASMVAEGNIDRIPRDKNMIDAAKRWLMYEVSDGTEVGMAIFSKEGTEHNITEKMTTISDDTRPDLVHLLDNVKFTGQTCIGCGLNIAMNWPMYSLLLFCLP